MIDKLLEWVFKPMRGEDRLPRMTTVEPVDAWPKPVRTPEETKRHDAFTASLAGVAPGEGGYLIPPDWLAWAMGVPGAKEPQPDTPEQMAAARARHIASLRAELKELEGEGE